MGSYAGPCVPIARNDGPIQLFGASSAPCWVKRSRNDDAAVPQSTNAANPAQVFAGFHGSLRPPIVTPNTPAIPSPKAMSPHTAAASSRRWRNTAIRASTAAGYNTMPSE